MKRHAIKLAGLLLVIALLLMGTAVAETPDIHTVVLPSGESYTFPMSADECKAAGIALPELAALSDGQYYPSVKVNNGREQFAVRVEMDAATGEFCVTGFNLNLSDIADATLADITLGKTTQTEVYDLLGADHYGTLPGASDNMTYYYFMGHEGLTIYFDSADANAVARHIIASSDLVSTYGMQFSAQDGVEDADLPADADLSFNQFILAGKLYQSGDTLQALLDNGWILPASRSADQLIAALDGSRASGDRFDLYNGSSIVTVAVYNTSESECTLADCMINQIVVDQESRAAFTIVDGLTIGSDAADAAKIFGEAVKQSANNDGTVVNTFTVLHNLQFEITELDGVVTNISIRGLMNN